MVGSGLWSPLTTCESRIDAEPEGWREPDFDDSAWPRATEFSAQAVGPKEGYTQIAWDPAARFIWSSDLELDNTVLCRVRVEEPG